MAFGILSMIVVMQTKLMLLLLRFQVHPTTLNLKACDTQLHSITITPTIPVRRTRRGLPKLNFFTPREVTILTGCEIELKRGVDPIQITVKASCGQEVSDGLKPVIPKIFQQNSRFWHRNVGLPTIWVIISTFFF